MFGGKSAVYGKLVGAQLICSAFSRENGHALLQKLITKYSPASNQFFFTSVCSGTLFQKTVWWNSSKTVRSPRRLSGLGPSFQSQVWQLATTDGVKALYRRLWIFMNPKKPPIILEKIHFTKFPTWNFVTANSQKSSNQLFVAFLSYLKFPWLFLAKHPGAFSHVSNFLRSPDDAPAVVPRIWPEKMVAWSSWTLGSGVKKQ